MPDRQDRQEQWAVFWCSLLSPLLYGDIAPEETGRFLRQLAATEHEFPDGTRRKPSRATLWRKWKRYREGGLEGLFRQRRKDRGRPRKASPAMIERAIELKKEQPYRSDETISGVSARLFGTFLTWLNDHRSDVFVVCTCNDISRLPPEFARAERFDGVFFLDLPGVVQKRAIWNICLDLFDVDHDQPKPKTQDWTGAEIRSCSRLASLLDVPLIESAKNVVPVAVTASETVDRLRSWASGRCLDADRPGIYTNAQAGPKRRRKIQTDPLAN